MFADQGLVHFKHQAIQLFRLSSFASTFWVFPTTLSHTPAGYWLWLGALISEAALRHLLMQSWVLRYWITSLENQSTFGKFSVPLNCTRVGSSSALRPLNEFCDSVNTPAWAWVAAWALALVVVLVLACAASLFAFSRGVSGLRLFGCDCAA